MQFRITVQLWFKTLERVAELDNLLTKYRQASTALTNALHGVAEIPDGSTIGTGLEISSQDFGYASWNAKTPDSTFFETYRVSSHLPNSTAIVREDLPVSYPGFLYVDAPKIPDIRGLLEWFYSGMRNDYPTGNFALNGWRNWFSRAYHRINLLFDFLAVVRTIVWPEQTLPLDER